MRALRLANEKHRPWLTTLLARRPTKVAAITLTNKIARMAARTVAFHRRRRRGRGSSYAALRNSPSIAAATPTACGWRFPTPRAELQAGLDVLAHLAERHT